MLLSVGMIVVALEVNNTVRQLKQRVHLRLGAHKFFTEEQSRLLQLDQDAKAFTQVNLPLLFFVT